MIRHLAIALILVGSAATCYAVETPPPGTSDYRIRTADFHDGQVYKITGFFGFHAIVIFGRDERIEKVGGFEKGWTINSLGDKILVTPKVSDADSNLTVVTNRRVYFFDLSVKPFPTGKYRSQAHDAEQIYGLRFRYPEDEARAAMLEAQAALAERKLTEAMNAASTKPRNLNYTYMGAETIRPYSVWDDGTFTYFKFYAQQDLPAFFVVNDDGSESVVNKSMEPDGDTLVVQRVGKQFVLRMGNSVVCIYNESQTIYTPSSGTETSSDRVQRVIKEGVRE